MRIILGVSGGIAAYKAVLLLRSLTEAGHSVRVVPTSAALTFVGAATWEALSGQSVSTEVFDDIAHVPHVALGQSAELLIVAPATADLLSRMATGRCDDLLTATLLTARCPILVAPAMHTEMWQHPATAENVATLRRRGITVLEPTSGRLTGKDSGPGRLPEPEDIAAAALALAEPARPQDLAGRRVLISAGGTREPIDPVRFLGNRSSGIQGYALACDARDRGAEVVLVAANVALDSPVGVTVLAVETTAQLAEAIDKQADRADIVVMAAAVADFRPTVVGDHKIKKRADGQASALELVANPDILAGLVQRRRPGQVIVGFAAETGDSDGDVLFHGRAKARRKNADLLVVNPVGKNTGFGTATNDVTVLTAAGDVVAAINGPKPDVARVVLDQAVRLLQAAHQETAQG